MGTYNCPECDWEFEVFYNDGAGIRTIINHDNTHLKDTKEVKKMEKDECTKCDGKGYIERWYTIDEDVPKTD